MRVPLFIEFSNRNVLVIGGGDVATKRALKFLNAGAKVTVLSREFTDELIRLAREGKILIQEVDLSKPESTPILEVWIRWADLVVLTVPDFKVKNVVYELCRHYRKFLNDATDASKTEVVVPIEGSFEYIRVAVTTEGKSSALARFIVQKILKFIEQDPEIRKVANAWIEIKQYLKSKVPDYKVRMRIYEHLIRNPEFERMLLERDVSEILKYVEETMNKLLTEKSS